MLNVKKSLYLRRDFIQENSDPKEFPDLENPDPYQPLICNLVLTNINDFIRIKK